VTQGATWSVFGPPSDVRFWRTAEPASAVWPLVTKIREDLTSQFDRYETALSLCTDSAASEITPGSRADAWAALDFEPLSLNVVETVCDTLHAEITQAQPRCMFLSVGGGYEMRRRIQKANRFVDGVFQECDVYGEAFPDCAHDAIRFGTGFVHVFAAHGKVQIERVHPWEILVDEVDGYDRRPRSMHRVKYMDRGQAAEMWPEHATAIEAAGMPSGPWAIRSTYVADVIVVIESWHLPSGPDAEDGRHVIVCDGATLVDEEWTRPNFPIAVMRWSRRPFGFYGRGVCEMLVGIQYNVNKTAIAIDIAHEQAGFQVWVERGSKINKAHIQNGIGTIGEFTGNPPLFMAPATVAPEMYAWLERQYQRAFERARTSSMAARAEIPAGLKNASGVALETYNDTTSKAYLPQAREYEGLAVDVGTLVVQTCQELAEADSDYEVVYRSPKGKTERIAWSDLRLDDGYVLQRWPTSLLPNTPTGKLARLSELVSSGLAQALGWGPETILRLMNFPDIESESELTTAPRDAIDALIDRMLDDLDPTIMPEPILNLALCMKVGALRYQLAIVDDLDEERMSLLRGWLTNTAAMMPAPPGAPPADGAPLAPPAAPQAPPVAA